MSLYLSIQQRPVQSNAHIEIHIDYSVTMVEKIVGSEIFKKLLYLVGAKWVYNYRLYMDLPFCIVGLPWLLLG